MFINTSKEEIFFKKRSIVNIFFLLVPESLAQFSLMVTDLGLMVGMFGMLMESKNIDATSKHNK